MYELHITVDGDDMEKPAFADRAQAVTAFAETIQFADTLKAALIYVSPVDNSKILIAFYIT